MSEQLSLFDPAHTATGVAVAQAADLLPRLAREMVEVMGEAATMALIHEMGGQRLIVPGWPHKRASSRFERLLEIVGPDAAKAFAMRWGNVEVQVPKASKALQLVRDQAIQRAYSQGTKPPELAKRFNLTEGQIWRVLKRPLKLP